MVTGIVGPASILFDDDPFRISRSAAYFGMHIVLAIVAWGKTMLAILKLTSSDITRQGLAVTGLKSYQ
jgi:hypothetical protein